MADQFLPNKVTTDTIEQVRFVLYSLDHADPKDEQTQTTATQVLEWAKTTVGFTDDQLKVILAEEAKDVKGLPLSPDIEAQLHDEKKHPYSELAEAIVHKVFEDHLQLTTLPEKVEIYQENRKKEDERQHQLAEAKLAQHSKLTWHQIVNSWIKTQTNIAEKDSSSTAPEAFQAITTTVIPELVLNSTTATQDVANFLTTITDDFPILELPYAISPIAENVVAVLDPATGALLEVATQKLQAAATTVPDAPARAAAAELVALEIIEPNASEEKIKRLVKKITLDLEKDGHLVSERLIEDATKLLSEFNIDAPLPEVIEKTYALELQKQTDVDPETAKQIAKLITFNKLSDFAYAVAKTAPGPANETPQQKQLRQQNIFTKINKEAILAFRQLGSPSLNQLLKRDVDFARIYKLMQYGPPPKPTFQEEDYQTPDDQGNSQPNQVIEFFKGEVQGRIQDRVQSEAWQAIDGWINGTTVTTATSATVGAETGTAVGATLIPASTALVASTATPIIGIIVGEATPAWVLAGIGHGLMNGTAVYAGVLSTGELMFVAPGSLAAAQALIATGGTALTTAGGTAIAGQTLIPVPVVGALIGAAIGFVVTKFPKLWKWIREHGWKPLVAGIAAIIGAFLGPLLGLGTLLGAGLGALIGGGVALAAPSTIASFTAGGVSGVLQPIGGFATHVFASLTELAVVEIATPIIIIIMSIPVVVALLLFIINSSAYVVPAGSFSPGNIGGNILPGCPASMWPVAINQGQRYYVRQGPGGPYSHGPGPNNWPVPYSVPYQEAIDITPYAYNQNLDVIVATHPGTVVRSRVDGNGGNYINILDSCGGGFQTLYVHMLVNYASEGQIIATGDIIGVMGSTGFSSGPHLHYGFNNANGSIKNRSSPPPYMVVPYIPKTVPQYCVGDPPACGVDVP